MEYMIGVNYWGSKHAVDMWKYWDEESVRDDFEALSKCGVKYARVFPNWRDFQPIEILYRDHMIQKEVSFPNDMPLPNEYGLDPVMLERFGKLCDFAEEFGIKLIVGVITGWMSGRLYAPPAIAGKNCMNDFEALSWIAKFAKGFVKTFKDRDIIAAWDIGNESNNIGFAKSRYEAINWTQNIRNAIVSEDNTRPVQSGMHALAYETRFGNYWLIQDQGEICDVLTPHPYPSPTVGGHLEKINTLRTTVVPTAQVELYSSLGGKPAMIQEQGSFSDILGDADCASDFMRVNLWSGWANGSLGYLWWCAFDQTKIKQPPQDWSMVENELGILREDYSPKKVGLTMKQVGEQMQALPFKTLPAREKDCVFILSEHNEKYGYLISSAYTLAKQAGLEMTFCAYNQKLPDSKLYIVPSSVIWHFIYKQMYYELMQRVKDGATLLITNEDGTYISVEEFMGIKSKGCTMDGNAHVMNIDGEKLPIKYVRKFHIEPTTAKVVATDDGDGSPVMTCNNYGKGKMFFLDVGIEKYLVENANALNDYPYYKIYQKVGEDILKNKKAVSNNPNIAVTIHPTEKGFIAVAINYSDKDLPCDIRWKEGLKVTPVKGDGKIIGKCDAEIFIVEE